MDKSPQNYAVERNESFSFEPKLVEIEICNEKEEAEIKKKELKKEKRNAMKWPKKNKLLKQQKKRKRKRKKRNNYGLD